jgi:hypothetical protein
MTAAPLVLPDPPAGIDQRVSTWMQQSKGKAYTFGLQSLPNVDRNVAGLNISGDKLQSWGQALFTTDGSGNVTITHGLLFPPNVVFADTLNNDSSLWMCNIITIGATTFSLKVLSANSFGTGTVNSTPVTIMWYARF